MEQHEVLSGTRTRLGDILAQNQDTTRRLLEEKSAEEKSENDRQDALDQKVAELLSNKDLIDFLHARGEELALSDKDQVDITINGSGELNVRDRRPNNLISVKYEIKDGSVRCIYSGDLFIKEGDELRQDLGSNKYKDLTAEMLNESVEVGVKEIAGRTA